MFVRSPFACAMAIPWDLYRGWGGQMGLSFRVLAKPVDWAAACRFRGKVMEVRASAAGADHNRLMYLGSHWRTALSPEVFKVLRCPAHWRMGAGRPEVSLSEGGTDAG